MLGQHTGNVSMMMLHTDFLWNVSIKGIFCCQVFGMQIMSDSLRVDIEETLIVFNALTQRGQGLQILQITNVMTDKRLASLAQAKGVLQMTTAGKERRWQV